MSIGKIAFATAYWLLVMISLSMEKFSTWLEHELNERDWKQADLVRASGLEPSTISNILNEKRSVGVEACNAIAKALKLPPVQVLRAAGLLPPADPKVDPDVEKGRELLQQMGDKTRDRAVRFLRMMLEAQEQEDRQRENAAANQRRRSSTAE